MLGMAVRFDPEQVIPTESEGSGSNFTANGKPDDSSNDDDDMVGVSDDHGTSDPSNGDGDAEGGEEDHAEEDQGGDDKEDQAKDDDDEQAEEDRAEDDEEVNGEVVDGDEMDSEDVEGEDDDEADDEAEYNTEDEEEHAGVPDRKGKGVDPRERGTVAGPGVGGDSDDGSGSDSDGDHDHNPKGKGRQEEESEDSELDDKCLVITGMSFKVLFIFGFLISFSYIVTAKPRRRGGRMPNSLLESAAALRLVIDGMIQALADSSEVSYANIYNIMGLHDSPAGRDVNLWNLFCQVMKQEWADTPGYLGKHFNKKVHTAYLEAMAGLDAEGEAALRKDLLARAKTAAKLDVNEVASMAHAVRALTKAVRIFIDADFLHTPTDNENNSTKKWSTSDIRHLMFCLSLSRPVKTASQGTRRPL